MATKAQLKCAPSKTAVSHRCFNATFVYNYVIILSTKAEKIG